MTYELPNLLRSWESCSVIICASCQYAALPSARFCSLCGSPLPGGQEQANDLSRRIAELTVLYQVSATCALATSEDDLLGRVTEALVNGLSETNCGFVLLDPRRACLVPHSSFFIANPDADRSVIPIDKGIIGQVARTGIIQRVGDVNRDAAYWQADSTTRSELCVPVLCRAEIVGVINVERHAIDAFSEFDERLVATIAKLVGESLQRLRTEYDLHVSEERYRRLFETCGDSIFVLDSSGRICAANPAAARTHGYTEAELLDLNVRDLDDAASAQQVPERIQRLLAGETLTFELAHRRKDGSVFPLEVVATQMQAGDQTYILALDRDITARKRTEQALREGHRYFNALFDQPTISVGQLDSRTGRILRVNQRYCEMLGYSREELLQLDFMAITHPDDLQADLDNMSRLKAGELNTFQMAKRLHRKDGTEIWVYLTVVPLWAPGAEPDFHLALLEDITERRRMEHSLRLIQFSIDRAADSVFWIAKNAEILYVNEAACRTLGYAREEMVGKTVHDIDPHFPPEAWRPHWEELKMRGSFTFESDHFKKDGTLIHTEVTVNYLQFEGREYNCAMMRDITERQKAEEELRRLEERFSKLFYASPFSIIVATYPEGKIVDANGAFLRLLELDRDEVLGKTTGELGIWVSPADRVAMVERLRQEQSARDMELRFRAKSGKILTLLMSVEIIHLDGRAHALAMSIDITDRKLTELQAHELRDTLAHANRLVVLGEIASGLAHELNQPLAAIHLYAETAQFLSERLNELDLQDCALRISEQSFRAGEIVRRMRSFIRKDSSRRVPLQIGQLIQDVLPLLTEQLSQHDVKVELNLAEHLPPASVDGIQIQQVLINLIRNAVDAMHQNVDHARLISIRTDGGETEIRVSISDSGCGLDPTVAAKLFFPFQTTKSTGLGLGLSICRTLIEAHGGRIEAHPNLDRGTTFVFTLPVYHD